MKAPPPRRAATRETGIFYLDFPCAVLFSLAVGAETAATNQAQMEAFDFVNRCRCGTTKCKTHEQVKNVTRQVLPPTVEPVSYQLDLACRIDDHEYAACSNLAAGVNH